MQTQNENYWMQETKFYEWLDSFCTGSYAELEIFGGGGPVWLWDLYHAEQEANTVGRNLVRDLILKIPSFFLLFSLCGINLIWGMKRKKCGGRCQIKDDQYELFAR